MAKRSVRRPHERFKRIVRNQSVRNAKVQLIVLHDTEGHDYKGTTDLEQIGALFDSSAREASAHVCVDAEGFSARYVDDGRKAWHCAGYNSVSLGIEQIGFASFSRAQWSQRKWQRRKVAKYIAYWSRRYGIPIRRGKVSDGRVIRSGVVTHKQLGAIGGGHVDPGSGYPFHRTLALARFYRRFGWK